MTSFAFIFGLLPLWYALGAGAMARRLIGTVAITGMLFSTGLAIFLVPALFVAVEWISMRLRGKVGAEPSLDTEELPDRKRGDMSPPEQATGG
jgi:HAE1 family hydrophobic/amphiphilic exporter-1